MLTCSSERIGIFDRTVVRSNNEYGNKQELGYRDWSSGRCKVNSEVWIQILWSDAGHSQVLVRVFLSVRGPDRGRAFDNRSDIGAESEFQVISITWEKASENKSGLPRGFFGSRENMVRKGEMSIYDYSEVGAGTQQTPKHQYGIYYMYGDVLARRR